jgi:hypothetical protein
MLRNNSETTVAREMNMYTVDCAWVVLCALVWMKHRDITMCIGQFLLLLQDAGGYVMHMFNKLAQQPNMACIS